MQEQVRHTRVWVSLRSMEMKNGSREKEEGLNGIFGEKMREIMSFLPC